MLRAGPRIGEAPQHPHAQARDAYVDVDGASQPAPAPRFDRTPAGGAGRAPVRGAHTDDVLRQVGYSAAEIDELRKSGAAL